MRIIAGEFRGRRLLPPASGLTRPITDRAKQSLFDILAPYLPGANVYDCFAGTGSLGLECLSRGAARATFFEQDRSALERLGSNVSALKVAHRVRIVADDIFAWFDKPSSDAAFVDCMFLDPPYRFLRDAAGGLRQLAARLAERLTPEGFIVFRHDIADTLALPGLATTGMRTYGGMAIEFLRRTPAAVSVNLAAHQARCRSL